MSTVNSVGARSPGVALRGFAVALLATTCVLISAISLSAPAGAARPYGPHAQLGDVSSAATSSTVSPLTLANVVVTNLATNSADVYSYDNPAPVYQGSNPSGAPCSSDPNAYICMAFGSGGVNGDGGYFFIFGGAPYTAGSTFTGPGTSIGVGAEGSTCDVNQPGYSAGAELDQYVATSNPFQVQTVAVQFDCTNSTVDISGTIAYNIVPTTPSSGYYVYGQQGELTGFGNDNYLVYLDGARVLRPQRSDRGHGPDARRWRLLDGRLGRRRVRQR